MVDDKRIVALLDNPSSKSFGMNGIIIKSKAINTYETLGLTRNRGITEKEFRQLQGHILPVDILFSYYFSNPVALWIGNLFYAKAITLKAPKLPDEENWHHPSEPNVDRGKYTIMEAAEAYKTLDDWTIETAREALQKNDCGLAQLTAWSLPNSPASKAALYYTAPTPEKQKRELEWQMSIERKLEKKLIEEHEKMKEILLKGE